MPLQLLSRAFKDHGFIPDKYTCDGENLNPPFTLLHAPRYTVTLSLIVSDADAPGGDWTHWLVWNIPSAKAEIPENAVPLGAIEGLNDFGQLGYGGPCPHSGAHRFLFTLYALDTGLDLSPVNRKPSLLKAMRGHVIEKTVLTGLYQRR